MTIHYEYNTIGDWANSIPHISKQELEKSDLAIALFSKRTSSYLSIELVLGDCSKITWHFEMRFSSEIAERIQRCF